MIRNCECEHGVHAVATVQVRVGRAHTRPAAVCQPTLERIQRIFPKRELTVVPVDPWQPLREAGYTELELRAAAGDK